MPPEHRRLFASQDELRYFAERFDFETGGVIGHGADVVFIDSTEPAGLAEVLADEMGTETEVVALDLCSLGGPGSGRETYIDMMWATADRIVEALTLDTSTWESTDYRPSATEGLARAPGQTYVGSRWRKPCPRLPSSEPSGRRASP